jgi:hypothetical protein
MPAKKIPYFKPSKELRRRGQQLRRGSGQRDFSNETLSFMSPPFLLGDRLAGVARKNFVRPI